MPNADYRMPSSSARDSTLRGADEFYEVARFGIVGQLGLDLRESLIELQPGSGQPAVGFLQSLDGVRIESLALQTDAVDPVGFGRTASHRLHVGQDILRGNGSAPHER